MCHKYHVKHTSKQCSLDLLKSGSHRDTNETPTCSVPVHAPQTNALWWGEEGGTTKALLYTLPWRDWMYRVALSLLAPKYHLNMIIFPREGNLWNFGVTHETHKRFLTGSNGSTYIYWKGRRKRSKTQGVFLWVILCGPSPYSLDPREDTFSTEMFLVRRRKHLCFMTRLYIF